MTVLAGKPGAAASPPGFPARGSRAAGAEPSDPDRALLSGRWRLTDKLRPFQPQWRVRECGRWAAWGHSEVELRQGDHGWTWGHVHRCGSVWACPACAHQISLERAGEVTAAVAWWQGERKGNDAVMLSLTVRHKAGDDVRELRRGVSAAWRALQQSRTWQELREACGVKHLIRCHDATWGEASGWHPHIHVLMLCERPEAVAAWQEELCACWRIRVASSLGAEHLPNVSHALDISPCHDAGYVARLGIEVGAPAAKTARGGHYSPMQLAATLASMPEGVERDRFARAWRDYAEGMSGCHQLQWSRGLRDAMGATKSDAQIVVDDVNDDVTSRPIIGRVPRETWRQLTLVAGALGDLDDLGKQLTDEKAQLPQCRAAVLEWFEELEGVSAHWKTSARGLQLRWDTC